MIMDGCQGKPRTPEIIEKICPRCGNEVELFTSDTEMVCENCGFTVYNDTLSCVQWCKYACQCVGDEMYEAMMKIADRNKAEIERQRAEKRAQKETDSGE